MSERYFQPESIKEQEPNPKEIEALIVLGKNKGMTRGNPTPNPNTKDVLSMESKMAALAAGWLYLQSQGRMKKIIFSGGKTSGSNWSSEALSMANYLKRHYPEIPPEALILEESSLDTASNALELKKLLEPVREQDPSGKVGLLTASSHLKRASSHMRAANLEFENFEIEKVLTKISPRHQKFVEAYLQSPLTKIDEAKEILIRFLEQNSLGRQAIRHFAKRRSK